MADIYGLNAATVGNVPTGTAIPTLVTDATLAYVNTNETLFSMAKNDVIQFYGNYHLQIKVTYAENPADVDLTIKALSLPEANATPLTAATLVESAAWDSKVIDLNTSGGTNVEYYFLEDITIRGNYLYLSYTYSGDPTNDVSVEIKLCRV